MKKLKDINWNQVYYFYEVARKGSMKQAAQIIGVSTPTVSEQIKRLETFLGLELFRRYPRKTELTSEGNNLFVYAKEIFESGTRFLDAVSPSTIGGYNVRVGIQETIADSVPLDFVTKYWDLFAPFGSVSTYREAMHEQLVKRLIVGDFDWIVSIEEPRSPRIVSEKIGTSEIVFCCSPEMFKKFKDKTELLKKLPLARSSWDQLLNSLVDDHLARARIFPDEVIESDHREFCVNLSRRGRCVTTFPKETVANSRWGKAVKTFRLEDPIYVSFFVAWKKKSERMVSIRKVKELLSLDHDYPSTYGDPNHQINLLNGGP